MKAPVIKLSLNHPVVLYFVLLVALANLLYLSVAGKYEFAAIFVMVGFLTSFFSKNMTVIMVVALVATSVLQFGGVAGVEGLENMEPEKKEEVKPEEAKVEEEKKPEEKKPEEKKPEDEASAAVDKLAEKQKDLVNKIEKMEPALNKIETFMDRLDKFTKYD
jgi:outer membrane biosynthesis protein TonB